MSSGKENSSSSEKGKLERIFEEYDVDELYFSKGRKHTLRIHERETGNRYTDEILWSTRYDKTIEKLLKAFGLEKKA